MTQTPRKPSEKPKNTPHPFTRRDEAFLPLFASLGFQPLDGYFCGGWDAVNKRGDVCTLLLQPDSLVLVQAHKLPHAVPLPSELKLTARELLHNETLKNKKA